MIRAVLDSSVLVSAFLKPDGTSAALLPRARDRAFLLCLSHEIVEETAVSLLRAKHQRRRSFTPDDVARFCSLLALVSDRVEGALPELRAVPDDPKDDMIVATAVAARADYLVTGDRRHLLPLRTYQGIRIVGVREFMDLLSG